MGASIQNEEPIKTTIHSCHEATFGRESQWAKNKAKFRYTVKQIKYEEMCHRRVKQSKLTSGISKSSVKLNELI